MNDTRNAWADLCEREGQDRELVDAKGAAVILGVAPDTVRKWARLGYFPSIHYSSRAVRFCVSDLEEFRERARRLGRDGRGFRGR